MFLPTTLGRRAWWNLDIRSSLRPAPDPTPLPTIASSSGGSTPFPIWLEIIQAPFDR
jgi:hypothetical protein